MHIVTSLIRDDGSRIDTHHLGIRLSEPTRKEIEQEFGLLSNRPAQTGPIPKIEEVSMIVPDSGIPVSQQIATITAAVGNEYSFRSLAEYNAILRCFNVTAETGKPGSKTYEHHGLYYVAVMMMAGRLVRPSWRPNFPTVRLMPKWRKSSTNQAQGTRKGYILRRIDLIGPCSSRPPTSVN